MKDNSEKHTIVLAGNGSYSNRGCEAITRGTVALLRREMGECRSISNYFPAPGCRDVQIETDQAITHRPFSDLKRHSLPWWEEQITRRVFRQPYNVRGTSRTFRSSLQEGDAVLRLGGDSFTLGNHHPRIHFKLSHLAMENKLPVAVWGASVGPFSRDPAFERWAAQGLRRVPLICVRETESQAYLARIGVEQNVMLAADPAFHLRPSECDLPAAIDRALADGCIGLNLSPLLTRFVRSSNSWEGKFSIWVSIAVELVRRILHRFSQPVLLIPHVTELASARRDDCLLLRRVAELLQEAEGLFVLGPDLNAAETKWVISRVRVFAGARTHSTFAAISSGIPTICIGYSIKAKGIATDVYGHLDWLVKGQDLIEAPSVLCDRLVSLWDQQSEISAHLGRMKLIFEQRAMKATESFADLIRETSPVPAV